MSKEVDVDLRRSAPRSARTDSTQSNCEEYCEECDGTGKTDCGDHFCGCGGCIGVCQVCKGTGLVPIVSVRHSQSEDTTVAECAAGQSGPEGVTPELPSTDDTDLVGRLNNVDGHDCRNLAHMELIGEAASLIERLTRERDALSEKLKKQCRLAVDMARQADDQQARAEAAEKERDELRERSNVRNLLRLQKLVYDLEAEIATLKEERAQIEEMLASGQGDDDGPQILPDFEDDMSLAGKVEICLDLLERRRDAIEGFKVDDTRKDAQIATFKEALTAIIDLSIQFPLIWVIRKAKKIARRALSNKAKEDDNA